MGGTDTMMVVKVQRPGEKISSPGISYFPLRLRASVVSLYQITAAGYYFERQQD